MDLKNKCAQYWQKALELWATFLAACRSGWVRVRTWSVNAWQRVRDWTGKAWAWTLEHTAKARQWLRAFWEKTRILLRKVWNRVNIWLTNAKNWLKKVFQFLAPHGKHALGWLAVLALKCRKWARKATSRLRAWWARCKGRKWLEEKTEKLRSQLPAPAPEEPEEEIPQQIVEEASEEEYKYDYEPEPVPVQPVRHTPRRRELGPVATVIVAVWKGIKLTCIWIYRLRKYIMAAPVAFYAVKLALANARRLPEIVGLDIQASGEFARMVSRSSAVWGPLGITAFCLVLVLCSRKPLLPWLISIFTLILPVLIWMTNYYA